ncbi:hypothetical protein BC629DRAFT_139283 [Irpex lacteus]|nr:hypothetical protein BC629DRAFT_139283 [Irpex lacteus]
MGLNGTAEGGKVKRRRRRDTNAVSTATAAATAGVPSGPNASSSLQDASPIDKQSGSGMSRNSAVRSNPAGGAVNEIPTDGAAHSPVSMNIPSSSSSTSVSLGHAIGSGAVSGPISGPSSAIEPIPPSNLHVPPRVASADEFGQQTMSHPSGAGHMRSPELYRALSGQMRVPQGMAHQLGPPYSHTTDPRISAERTHPLHREGHAGLQPDGMHRVYPGHDEAYSSMPTRLQVQVPSQDIQQQFRSLRTDVPRLVSRS